MKRLAFRFCIMIAAATSRVHGTDPVMAPPMPPGAVGVPDRSPDLDAMPGFRNPPPGFGSVPFYWWLGDKLTKERLAWQLEQMEGMGVSGYQINYAHSERATVKSRLTYASDPPLFSEDWWELVGWFMKEAKKQGAGVSLSDYTLGFGQGYMLDDLLKSNPEVTGMVLQMDSSGKVVPRRVPWTLDPMHPVSGPGYADRFFGQFERRFPGDAGKGLNFFFSDELQFGVAGWLWSERFAEQFRMRKGYDIMPELPSLFKDTGPRTPKIRMDYSDVMVALTEENFFRPLFGWHQQRGMIHGCDHGGRGRQVDEFGDYFRTQRWNQGPGADQPRLAKDLIKAKVAASMASLYERPRVWLEGFYSSGWGTSSADFVDAVLANYALGFNLLGIHGMYYTTHGGWWEWAPPDNTFRMPYWRHMKGFMEAQQRLAYLLSQGHHRCDVAIMYPVAPVEAGMNGKAAVDAAFKSAQAIHSQGIDFVFMDFQSLDRARIVGNELHVSGNVFKVLVLPGMSAIRHSSLKKAVDFKRAGGVVLAVGDLPQASDRVGRDDPEVAAMVAELFPKGAVSDLPSAIPFRDYRGPGWVLHRRVGLRDVYALYGAPNDSEAFFRATGKVELWDHWTGGTRPLPVISQDESGTKLKLPLTAKEMQLIVFSPGTPVIEAPRRASQPSVVRLDGDWEFELCPTLDNRFGDFHWPPSSELIGAEARRMKYADETLPDPGWQDPGYDDSNWHVTTCGFGPRFWKLGPLPDSVEADAALAALDQVNPGETVRIGGNDYSWQPYDFSWRFGIPGDCGRQGYHGLKIVVNDELIGLGGIAHGHPECQRVAESGGKRYYLWSSVFSPRSGEVPFSTGGMVPSKAWLGGRPLDPGAGRAQLSKGSNRLLLRYDAPGRGWLVFGTSRKPLPPAKDKPIPWNTELASIWHNDGDRLPFDIRPQVARPAGWYRFISPPGLRALHLPCSVRPDVWADGTKAVVSGKPGAWTATVLQPGSTASIVAIRLEQIRGEYAGAAFSDYLKLDCGPGRMKPGDWSKHGILETYSGAAWYRKEFELPADAAGSAVTLDLGQVCTSAEVRVNGRSAGIRVAPPWTLNVTDLVKPGSNRIEVLVCNTLSNHYATVPTHYRGKPDSGLLGPVTIKLEPPL